MLTSSSSAPGKECTSSSSSSSDGTLLRVIDLSHGERLNRFLFAIFTQVEVMTLGALKSSTIDGRHATFIAANAGVNLRDVTTTIA